MASGRSFVPRPAAALSRLSEPHRLVFELAVYQELPYAEIGAVLDIPVGTVKSRMHNSVRALKEVLGEPAHGAPGEAPESGAASFRGATRGRAMTAGPESSDPRRDGARQERGVG